MKRLAGYQELVGQLFNQRSKLQEYYQIQLFRPLLKWLQEDAKKAGVLLSEKKLNLKIYQSFVGATDSVQMARHLLLNLNSLILHEYPQSAAQFHELLTREYGEITQSKSLSASDQRQVGPREQEIAQDLDFLLNRGSLKKAS